MTASREASDGRRVDTLQDQFVNGALAQVFCDFGASIICAEKLLVDVLFKDIAENVRAEFVILPARCIVKRGSAAFQRRYRECGYWASVFQWDAKETGRRSDSGCCPGGVSLPRCVPLRVWRSPRRTVDKETRCSTGRGHAACYPPVCPANSSDCRYR